jgi:hypothetical protein
MWDASRHRHLFDLGRATAARFVCLTVSSCSASAA